MDTNHESTIRLTKGNQERLVSYTELKTEISQCLQIENLNFLIGAGCSSFYCDGREYAIPTMGGLAKKFYEQNPNFNLPKSRKKAADNEDFSCNLEALITHLTSIANISSPKMRKTVANKISQINSFIFDEVVNNASQCTELLQIYKDFYLRIVKKTRQVPVNVFTTNYDLYNETALDMLGFMYNNGFLGSAKRVFNPNAYNYVVVENLNLSRDVWKSVSNFINLYKIHGSINWIKEDDPTTDTPRIIEKDIDLIRARKQFDSLMIYPTPQKDRTTLMVPYSDLFRIMQNSLLKRNSLLITMGYSFSDEHINRILLNALSVYDFRMVIFGDSPRIQRLREIGDNRIWIINSDGEEPVHFFKNIVENVLPSIDDEQNEEQERREAIRKLHAILGEDSANE
jgi:hypothetical protein